MTLKSITKSFHDRRYASQNQFMDDFGQIVKRLKPDAQQFSFDGNQESDDEGGSTMYFSSFYIDGMELEEIVKENPTISAEVFDVKLPETLDEEDIDGLYDSIRDNFYDLPEFVYENTWKINP